MTYDFETLTPARDDAHPAWAAVRAKGITDPDTVCYGVAEMKFPLAPAITEALHSCVDTGYFGYMCNYGGQTVSDFYARRHGWRPDPSWITQTYGVVSAIAMSIRAFTAPGEGVLIQTPVYNPFAENIAANGRRVVENPLRRVGDRYEMDFDDLERKAAAPDVKLMVLCSPHNPVGRVWSREELERVHEICARNGVLVVSDEIHSDLTFGAKHTVYAALSPEAAQSCVICTAPSKTFNLPGLVTSNIIVPYAALRERFLHEKSLSIGHYINIPGLAAEAAAYTRCDAWLDELQGYLGENAALFRRLVQEKLPGAWTPAMEGTYLAWLDLSYLGLDDDALEKLVVENAQLMVNMGRIYGTGGAGFVRVNIGCPRRYVEKFVNRLAEAIGKL